MGDIHPMGTTYMERADSNAGNSTQAAAATARQAAQIRVVRVRSVHRRHAVCCRGMLQASCDMLGDQWLL
jgi:hypothetical protein